GRTGGYAGKPPFRRARSRHRPHPPCAAVRATPAPRPRHPRPAGRHRNPARRCARCLYRRLSAAQWALYRTCRRSAEAALCAARQGQARDDTQLEHDREDPEMITIFGSTNLDQTGTVTRLPRPGETVAGGTFSMAPGGKGANQALAARRAGAEVLHVSAVGDDAFADLATALLREGGVDLTRLRQAESSTCCALIFSDAEGENVIAILPGANGTVSPEDADTGLAALKPGDTVLV